MTDYLSRGDAAAFLQQKGVPVTAGQLAKLASSGRGPSYSRFGKHALYRPEDLLTWLASELKPVTHGRTQPRTA